MYSSGIRAVRHCALHVDTAVFVSLADVAACSEAITIQRYAQQVLQHHEHEWQ
jgi:hypothetical protein